MGDQAKITIRFDEKTQIVYQRVEGSLNVDDSKMLIDKVFQLKPEMREPEKVRVLVFSDIFAKPTPGARKMLMENTERDDFYKMALVGKNPYMRAVMSFFLRVGGSKKVRAFNSEEAAIRWLEV